MREWYENTNGNNVSEDEYGTKTTVYCCRDGNYRGICDGLITADSFSNPEEAMEAINENRTEFIPIRPKATDTPWKPSQKGGYHRTRNGILICAKQSSNGSWFAISNGQFLEGHWFKSAEESMDFLDRL